MKIRRVIVSALAGLAVSGLFAAPAGAEGVKEYPVCGSLPPAEVAYLNDPRRTTQEIREAWQVNEARYCATAVVPAAEADEAFPFIAACVESVGGGLTKADAEACFASWYAKSGSTEFRRRQAERHPKAKAKRHKAKRQRPGGLALASALRGR